MTYKLVFPDEAPVKKNNFKQSYTRKDKKTGKYVALNFPISYYTPEYYAWAWKAVEYLKEWKHKNLESLLDGQYIISCLFYRKTSINLSGVKGKGNGQTIDLQNLYDSVLDCMAGNSGVRIPKKMQLEHTDYKIITDDSFAFVKNHGGSFIFQDFIRPRTEVYISEFTFDKLSDILKISHEDINWDNTDEEIDKANKQTTNALTQAKPPSLFDEL